MTNLHAPLSGVFFDLDGTLMDTAADFVIVTNQMRLDRSLPALPVQQIAQQVSNGSCALMQFAFTPDSPEQLQQNVTEFLQRYEQQIASDQCAATLYEGMDTLLTTLESKHIVWGVVTNKPRTYAEILMQQLGLSERCKALICPEDVTQAKPSPEGLLLACQQNNIQPSQCIYVGDHHRDIDAGNSAGMITVIALYGYIDANENPEQWQADIAIHSATELLQWIASHYTEASLQIDKPLPV